MRVLLINPDNPVVTLTEYGKWDKLNKYRVWKPLGLLTLANLTPAHWDVDVIDENLGPADYDRMPRPDVVGLTAFTSQANRAYRIAALFRAKGVPVIMGGIHATMCEDEALQHADTVVTGEAEEVWAQVLADAAAGRLQRRYAGGLAQTDRIAAARHDLFAGKYYFGAIQTTRGCPLCCNFCSVTVFNGGGKDIPGSVRRIQKHRISVVGSFIMGIDTDEKGIGEITARACDTYGLDAANVMILTPLPGTALYREMAEQQRIIASNYPEDWQYYTLCHPVAQYRNFSWPELNDEIHRFNEIFYSYGRIIRRLRPFSLL